MALSDRQQIAFLAMITGPDEALEVVVLYRMMRYMDLSGAGYHDRVLGLVGDIFVSHQYPTVEVPGTAFHHMLLVGTVVQVPTVAAMAALIPAWGDDEPTLGPFDDQALKTEVVRTRHIQVATSVRAVRRYHAGASTPGTPETGVHGNRRRSTSP